MTALGWEVESCFVCNLYFVLVGIGLIGLKLWGEIKLKGNVPDLIAQWVVGQARMRAVRIQRFQLLLLAT